MNVFKNTKIFNKIIIIFLFIFLLNFLHPSAVKADVWKDVGNQILAAPAKIIFFIEKGALATINAIFCDSTHRSQICISPEAIIKGKFLLLDANIFEEADGTGKYDGANEKLKNGKNGLRDTIAGWYYALRNLAIVALLSILVYIGIRMMITSISQDKAKYKRMFKDWLVALCLLMVMHYIMIGILNMTTYISEAISSNGEESNQIERTMEKISSILNNEEFKGVDSQTGDTLTLTDAYGLEIVFGAIIVYTIIFAVKYLFRMIMIVFLILVAPITCITYPIDKISDGKAQAYNYWFQEFLYQVIIQPFHLLIYVVLIGSASALATENILYSIMCFAVMIPAEKFIKQMFGFKDKLGSPLGSFAAGAVGSQLMNKLLNKGSKGGGSSSPENNENKSTQNELAPKTVDQRALLDGNARDSVGTNHGSELPAGSETQANENNETVDGADIQADGGDNPAEGSDAQIDAGDDSVEASEEQINTADDSTEEKDPTAETGSESDSESNNTEEVGTKEKIKQFATNKWQKGLAIHNERVSKKYGTTNRKKRWVKRAGKGAKALAKGALKGTAIAGVAAAATTAALATGNLKGAAGIVGGVAAYTGRGIYKGGKKAIKGVKGAAKDYNQGLSNDERKEKKAFNKFNGDSEQIDKAVFSYRKRNNGEDPSYEALEKEMRDRFELSRYGLTDDQIDESIARYQELKASKVPQNKALNEAVYENQLANEYKGKFGKKKDMEDALEATTKQFTEKGAQKEIAEKYARRYLTEAAKMKNQAILLPQENQTVDIPLTRSTAGLANSLGINGSGYTEAQAQRVSNLNIRLHDAGYSDSEINALARNCADSQINSDGVITNFEDMVNASVEYIEDGNIRSQAEPLVRAMNNGKAPKEKVDAEMRERFILKSTFDVKKEDDLTALRDLETETYKNKSQIQAAREFAVQNKGKSKADTAAAKKKLVKKLEAGGSSHDKAVKDAENVANLAYNYNNK